MKYDAIIGVGHSCLCAEFLRRAKLSSSTYPLDWMVAKSDSLITCAINEFDGIFEEYEVLEQKNGDCLEILDKKYNFISIHDVKIDLDFQTQFAELRSKTARRVERWKVDIRKENVCVVRLDNFVCEINRMNELCDVLKSINPKIHFHYLLNRDFSCDEVIKTLRKEIVIHRTNFVNWHDIDTDESFIRYIKDFHND